MDQSHVLKLADLAAIALGRVEHLQKQSEKLAAKLCEVSDLPKETVIVSNGVVRRCKAYVWNIDVVTTRSLGTGGFALLERTHPDAYRAAVSLKPPATSHQCRLESSTRGKSRHWLACKTIGEDSARLEMADRFGHLGWTVETQLNAVAQLRDDIARGKVDVSALKRDIVDLTLSGGLPRVMRGRDDSCVRVRENKPSRAVDYDLLERQFPEAATLIQRRVQDPAERLVTRVIT